MAIPPFNIAETVPADSSFVRLFPQAERTYRDIVKSWLSLEHDPTTGRHAFPVDTTVNLGAMNFATGSLRYDTTLDVAQINVGGGLWDTISLQPGQQVLLRNTGATAPPGYTKQDLTTNQYAVMVSNATPASADGGTTNFTNVFTSRTITQGNLPNVSLNGGTVTQGGHTHTGNTDVQGNHVHAASGLFHVSGATAAAQAGAGAPFTTAANTNLAGAHAHTVVLTSEGLHNHNVSVALGGAGQAMDFAVARIGFNLYTRANPS